MNWINFFFYVIVLNSLTGTVAYLLCKLLALVAKKYNAIRIIYLLYRLVLLFYIVPLGYIYIRSGAKLDFSMDQPLSEMAFLGISKFIY